MRSGIRLLAAAAATLVLATACGDGDGDGGNDSAGGSENKGSLTIAAANFPENLILANVYAQVLEAKGYDTEVKTLTNREVIEGALEDGSIDVAPEYVGTLTEFLNKKQNGPNAEAVASGDLDATVEALRKLAEEAGLTVLEPSEAADQNAFAVTKAFAETNSLTKLSDLTKVTTPLTLGGPPECPGRPFCRPGLEGTYGLKIAGFKALDAGGPLTLSALKDGSINLGLVFSSSSAIQANDLVVLEDDKNLQTVDNIVAVVNTESLTTEIEEALNAVADALTTEKLIDLNGKVELERGKPEQVAEDFVQAEGLG